MGKQYQTLTVSYNEVIFINYWYYILFLGSENILLTKNLRQRTDTFIKNKLEAPSMAILKQWTLEDNPDTKWKEVKKTVRRFRNSLPIVSQNIPDGRATSARSKYLPKVFRAPAWVAADLGIWNLNNYQGWHNNF